MWRSTQTRADLTMTCLIRQDRSIKENLNNEDKPQNKQCMLYSGIILPDDDGDAR
jgi:hypothetical protein